MRKLVTLLAAVTLAASSFAVAETTTPSNPNDPLQQIAPNGSEPSAPTTLADADAPAAAASTDSSMDTAKPMAKKHHHKKPCKTCKHHCKTHHHKMKAAAPTPASEHEMQPETTAPASQ
jgi:hypothetical protein